MWSLVRIRCWYLKKRVCLKQTSALAGNSSCYWSSLGEGKGSMIKYWCAQMYRKEWVCAELESNKQYIKYVLWCMQVASKLHFFKTAECVFILASWGWNKLHYWQYHQASNAYFLYYYWNYNLSLKNCIIFYAKCCIGNPLAKNVRDTACSRSLESNRYSWQISVWNGNLFLKMKFQNFLGKVTTAKMFLIGFTLK